MVVQHGILATNLRMNPNQGALTTRTAPTSGAENNSISKINKQRPNE